MDEWKYEPARDLGLPSGERMRSLKRESGLTASLARLGWRALIRFYLGAWHRLTIEGREYLPREAPFILIANHASHIDAAALAVALPARLRDRVLPLAAGDTFFEIPALAAFATWLMNCLPLWRKNCGRHALGELRERLIREPCAYILFPEGTRTRDGKLGPFKPGLGMIIAGVPAPVVPCWLSGAFQAMPPGQHWPRPARLRLRFGPALRFDEVENSRAGWETISARAREAVAALAPEAAAAGEASRP